MPRVILLSSAHIGKGADAELLTPSPKSVSLTAAQANELKELGIARDLTDEEKAAEEAHTKAGKEAAAAAAEKAGAEKAAAEKAEADRLAAEEAARLAAGGQ